MNKCLKTIVAAAVSLLVASPAVFAFDAPVGNATIPFGTPSIDGEITAGEWIEDGKLVLNGSNLTAGGWVGEVPADFNLDLYTMWDDTNLYVAGVITDSTFCYSEGNGNYNGDAVQLSLNLGTTFKTDEHQRAIFYSFGCREDGGLDIMVQESSVNDGDIADCGHSKKTDSGWQFEFQLPWATMQKHVSDKASVDVDIAAGTTIGGLVCYLDRDESAALVNAFLSSTTETAGWDPDVHGINFSLAAYVEPVVEEIVDEAPAAADEAPVAADAAAATTTTAAQTSDALSLAICAVAAAGAVLVISKKRK